MDYKQPVGIAVDQIKNYDRALNFRWNIKRNRWELWRRTNNVNTGNIMVLRVENPDGSYRPVDSRLLKYLVNCDTWRHKNADQQARDMAYYEQRQREKEDRNYDELLTDIGKSNRLWNAYQAQYR